LWVTHPSSLAGLARQRFPAVVLLQEGVPAPLGSVRVDERRASRLVVEHLLALGHRRLAYYATSDGARVFEHLRARRDAFLAEARAAGAPVAPADVLAGPPAVAAACLARIARRAAGAPTAIVCAHRELASGVLELAERAGLGVPRALSVVSWEVVGAPEHAGRALTGVRIPIWEMGKAAAELAATLSRREVPPGARHLTFAPALQVGSSSGPPPPPARP
jgi:LacI family transcriptional regulator